MSITNIFTTQSKLKNDAFDFKGFTIPAFQEALNSAIESVRGTFQTVAHRPVSEATFENTILALEQAFDDVEYISGIFFNLLGANATPELQLLAPEVSERLSALSNDLILNEEIFARVEFVNSHPNTNWQAPERQLLENTYTDFVRNGAKLTADQKTQLRTLDAELSRLNPLFQENVLKATNAFELLITSENEVPGLPSYALEQARQAALAKGKQGWLFNLQAPSYTPVMQFCSNREVRRQMYLGQATRGVSGEHDNRGTLRRIVELRHARARLLGFSSHADFVLRKRMAETPERVIGFLDDLLAVVKPAAERELAEMRAYALQTAGVQKLEPWDVSYFSEKMKKEKFDLDPDELRPYFPLESVVAGVFEHAHRLYGLTFKETKDYPTYHPDVRVYEVSEPDGRSGQRFTGLFYADFFPRETKQGGAWMTNYLQQGLFRGKERRPHVSIVCNFPKPSAIEPSLLSFNDVRTLFHEFGHSLHSLLSKVKYRSLSGTNVLWDFVELPSQIMENWALEREGLAMIAKHYQTGASLPTQYIDKLRNSAKFHAGLFALRQLNLGYLDMAFHANDPATWSDVLQFEKTATQKSILIPAPDGCVTATAFSHIFSGGYSAGYYSYKWAEVLEADAFEYFRERGVFDAEVAGKFREHILSRGGSEHPRDLYRRFRGRDPDPKALLRREGFVE
jgi:peptidyl-dipeptidase Dcp